MSSMSEKVVIDYDEIELDREDLNAILFEIEERSVWIPRSLILNHDEDERTITVPEWFAIDKELV